MLRAIAAAVAVLIPAVAGAQSSVIRPALDWRTTATRYFDVHFPARMADWAGALAVRLDAVHDAVSAFVGFAPGTRITVIVEDPLNQSNGFASAPLDAPVIVLWPTPPEPSGMLGAHRSWPELLAVHEYAHIAHLVRPSRNPRERRLWRLLPVRLGPIARRAPRWVVEGYATYVEGRLTGSGRPHSAARAAYLRQWALEGRLPTYAQLSFAGRDYASGAMAYLAGSAFLEWLVERHGEPSLTAVWRRLSARQQRSFAEAFAGVFGAPPDELYGRFTVELTRHALTVRDSLEAAGLEAGALVHRRRYATGEPAVSHDGRYIAVALPAPTAPGPVVVWRTRPPIDTARERRARERLLARDPLDVPAVPPEARPRVAVATLRALRGRPFHSPRFLPDTSHVLVAHDDPLGDGAYRTDLYVWNFRTGALRRVTRGAGVRDADPLPDGTAAIAARCARGVCDLVRVDLESGVVTVVAAGTIDAPYHRPRVSPDGRTAVASRRHDGRWRLALVALGSDANGAVAFADPDDGVSRFDATFSRDGRSLVAVSEAGGVPNVERIDLATGAVRALTQVTSAVFAPEPSPADTAILFLHLHARGLDLRQVPADTAVRGRPPSLSAALAPAAARPAVGADSFPVRPVSPPRRYGVGPRHHRLLPGGAYAAEGGFATLSLIGTDPVGRLAYTATGAFGDRSAARGGVLATAWRGSRSFTPGTLTLEGAGFHVQHRPSRQRTLRGAAAAPPGGARAAARVHDADLSGATLGAVSARDLGHGRTWLRVGASAAAIRRPDATQAARALVFAETRNVLRVGVRYGLDLAAGGHVARGATGGLAWTRALATATTDVRTPVGSARLEGTLGTAGGSVGFERFAIGGWSSPFVDAPVLSQRIGLPALPAAAVTGRRVAVARASASLGGLRPFYWLGSAGDRLDRWHRVAGLDGELTLGALPSLALPATSLRAGAAYSWDEPFRHRVQVYIGIAYRP